MACLMGLPIIFVCEDNELAVHTHKSLRHGYDSIVDIISKFNCQVLQEETTDGENIYKLASKAIDLVNTARRPCFIHLKYYRYLEHVGINSDFNDGYRSKDEFDEWYKVDPVRVQRDKLIGLGYSEDEIKKFESSICEQIDDIVIKVKKSSFVDVSELYNEVF